MKKETDLTIFNMVINGVKADNALTPQTIPNFNLAQGFKAGTQILLADGTSKNIEHIQYGDIIQSWDLIHKTFIPVKTYGAVALGYTDEWSRYIATNGQFLDVNTDAYIYSRSNGMPRLLSAWEPKFQIFTITNEREKIKKSAYPYQDIVFTQSYIILSENSLYFANGILCGHMPQDLYKYAMLGKLPQVDEKELSFFLSLATAWKENEMCRLNNPLYLLTIGDIGFEFAQSSSVMDDCDKKLQMYNLTQQKQQELALKKATLWGERKVQGTFISAFQRLYHIEKKSAYPMFKELYKQQIEYIMANKES